MKGIGVKDDTRFGMYNVRRERKHWKKTQA